MKDSVSKNREFKMNLSGLDVFMEYWVELGGKMGEKHTFWEFFGDMYRYMLGSGHFWPTCTGTGQGCTGTCDALFPISTCFCIVAITYSFIIRFE